MIPTNSNFQLTIAALKHFGLAVDEGSKDKRRLKLTPLALDILEHPEGSAKYSEAIKAAALTPKIHRELWDKYAGKLPPDVSIRVYLVREREEGYFNKNQVDGFIGQFRSTIAFAKLLESDKLSLADGTANREEVEKHPPDRQQRRRIMQPGIKEDVFNLEEGTVVVQYPERLTKASFEDFESYLQLVIKKAKRSVESSDDPMPDEETK